MLLQEAHGLKLQAAPWQGLPGPRQPQDVVSHNAAMNSCDHRWPWALHLFQRLHTLVVPLGRSLKALTSRCHTEIAAGLRETTLISHSTILAALNPVPALALRIWGDLRTLRLARKLLSHSTSVL